MTDDNFECEIGVTVNEMLEFNLWIPDYQRPYKWSEKNVSELFFDILNDMDNKKEKDSEYRIGTIILHTEGSAGAERYNIVDGQQRIISLNLLLDALGQPINLHVLNDSAGVTKYHVRKNREKLEKLVKSELTDETKKEKYICYLLKSCTFVKITTTSQDKAFQFFDSQNNRGKELELYDILKAYHLREFSNNVSAHEKYEIVEKWEETETGLRCLFNDYLYQIKQWSKSKNGNRSKWKMDDKDRFFEIFKGIRNNSSDTYAKYHISVNREFRQIDMPVISGQSFFYDIFYYLCLQKDIETLITKLYEQESNEILRKFKNIGDKYINDMMKCALLFIAVKFGIRKIKKDSTIINKILVWAWSLRLCYWKISKETINNYAIGDNNKLKINKDKKMFTAISDAITINQISEIELESPKDENPDNKREKTELSKFINDLLCGGKNV